MRKVEDSNEEKVIFDEIKYRIRGLTDSYYDMQKLRIATGNRLYQAFKHDDEDDEGESFLRSAMADYNVITKSEKSVKAALREYTDAKVIKSVSDYEMIQIYAKLVEAEQSALKIVSAAVKEHPMWDKFFDGVKGCGPLLAASCIAYLDVHKARHVSSFWSYAGVGTRISEEGERVAMSKKTLVDQEYTDKEGNPAVRKSIGYNATLHTKLLGVFVSSILKTGKGGTYWKCYYDYKERYKNRADLTEASDMRIHRMAGRQCVKMFLRDLWVTWRSYEGYTLSEPYEVEYLKRAPHKYNEYHARMAEVK